MQEHRSICAPDLHLNEYSALCHTMAHAARIELAATDCSLELTGTVLISGAMAGLA